MPTPTTFAILSALLLLCLLALAIGKWRLRVQLDSMRRALDARAEREDELLRLARSLAEAHENHRNRIAQELHDNLGQRLLVIRNFAQLAPQLSRPPMDALADLAERAGALIDDVRRLAYGLRPHGTGRLELAPSVRELAEDTAKAGGMELSWHSDRQTPSLPGETGLVLFRVAQEALQNVLRHSGATRVVVSLTTGPGGLVLRVRDNGAGFDPGDAAAIGSPGMGLTGMRDRLRLVEGALNLTSAPGAGCTLEASVPWPAVEGTPS